MRRANTWEARWQAWRPSLRLQHLAVVWVTADRLEKLPARRSSLQTDRQNGCVTPAEHILVSDVAVEDLASCRLAVEKGEDPVEVFAGTEHCVGGVVFAAFTIA